MAGPERPPPLPEEKEPFALMNEATRDAAKAANKNQKKAVLACISRQVFLGELLPFIMSFLLRYPWHGVNYEV